MNPYVGVISPGVSDLTRAREFYSQGLGWPSPQDYGDGVGFGLDEGSSAPGLSSWNELANDAGVAPQGRNAPMEDGQVRGRESVTFSRCLSS